MVKFHITPTSGEARACSATSGRCPYGNDDTHYSSAEAARSAYEAQMSSQVLKASTSSGENLQSYQDLRPKLNTKLLSIQGLALGRNHDRALDVLQNALAGIPSKGFRGGRHQATALGTYNELIAARKLIGPKGNISAYNTINEILEELEETKELKKDNWFQAEQAMKKAKLPRGAKRVFDKRWGTTFIELPEEGRIIQSSAVPSGPYYTIRYSKGLRSTFLGGNSDLQALLKGDIQKLSSSS